MTTPLTPGRAIAWAAIFDAHEHRLPHWDAWSADLRAWADAQTETPCRDTNNEAESGTMETFNRTAPASARTLKRGPDHTTNEES